MKRKHSLTLLEILIVMVLMGTLLTGVFSTFYKVMRTHVDSRQLRQTTLQLELFEHTVKHLITQTHQIRTARPSEAKGEALLIQLDPHVDYDWAQASAKEGMLYINTNHQLCLVSWSAGGQARQSVLLDQVKSWELKFFDSKQKQWQEQWPSLTEEPPAMISLTLQWREQAIPFTFFPARSKEQISYRSIP